MGGVAEHDARARERVDRRLIGDGASAAGRQRFACVDDDWVGDFECRSRGNRECGVAGDRQRKVDLLRALQNRNASVSAQRAERHRTRAGQNVGVRIVEDDRADGDRAIGVNRLSGGDRSTELRGCADRVRNGATRPVRCDVVVARPADGPTGDEGGERVRNSAGDIDRHAGVRPEHRGKRVPEDGDVVLRVSDAARDRIFLRGERVGRIREVNGRDRGGRSQAAGVEVTRSAVRSRSRSETMLPRRRCCRRRC